MSDRDPATINAEVHADWLTITGVLAGLLDHARHHDKSQPSWVIGPDASGLKMTVYAGEGIGRVTADVWVWGDAETTNIRITTARGNVPYWEDRITQLNKIAIEMRSVRQMVEPDPFAVIEHYYRSRAAGGKVTLKQLAEQTKLSYSTLRKRKMDYDTRGKWGSGRNKTGT